MAKMRTRRTSLIKARDPLFELRGRVAQARDVRRELRKLGTAHEQALFVDGVVGKRLAGALGCIALPARERAHAVADALRGDIADEARELVFHVRAQIARQVTQLCGERPRAADARERDHGARLWSARPDAPARRDVGA